MICGTQPLPTAMETHTLCNQRNALPPAGQAAQIRARLHCCQPVLKRTPRRWLQLCSPELSGVIADAIGDRWINDLSQLAELKAFTAHSGFLEEFLKAKTNTKRQFCDWLHWSTGQTLDPNSIFDCQIKRIHEYKRQLLNALRIVALYNRLRENPGLDVHPRTFFFSGKAAPAYRLAKVITKFINNLAATIDADPPVRGRLKVVFLPDYCVSLAEHLIPASDVSNQISTAGYEASRTSNMKFMMNGAPTIGTRDGATIEMAAKAGEENFFLFGLTAVDEQLVLKGFTQVEKDADLNLAYHASVREEKNMNLGVGHGWRVLGGWEGAQPPAIHVGMLLIDMYDPAKNSSSARRCNQDHRPKGGSR